MRYRDMLLNDFFTDTERQKIVGIANAVMRWLSGTAIHKYIGDEQNEYLQLAQWLTQKILETHYEDMPSLHRLFTRIRVHMAIEYWLNDDAYLFTYARWEVYWLLRGTTALDVTYEMMQDSVA